jgi:hypothetical protein
MKNNNQTTKKRGKTMNTQYLQYKTEEARAAKVRTITGAVMIAVGVLAIVAALAFAAGRKAGYTAGTVRAVADVAECITYGGSGFYSTDDGARCLYD